MVHIIFVDNNGTRLFLFYRRKQQSTRMFNIKEVHLEVTRDHVPAESAKYLSYKYHRPYKLNELPIDS